MGQLTTNTTTPRNATTPGAATSRDSEGANAPRIDRGSLFRSVTEARSESQRFVNREGISQREVDKRGHVADTRGLDKDGRQVGVATFGHDSAAVRQQTKDMVKAMLPELRDAAREGHMIVLDGHTSLVGAEGYNQRLSQRRAEAIRDYLVKAGIPKEQIEIRAHGEKAPLVAEERTRQHQAVNRRVAIHVERSKAAAVPAPTPTPPAREATPIPQPPATPAVKPTPAPRSEPAPRVEPIPVPQPSAPPMWALFDPPPLSGIPAHPQQDVSGVKWPLFNQPQLGGILAQPQQDMWGLKLDTVLRPDFLGVGSKQNGFVDFSKPAPMMVDPIAGIGAKVSPVAPTPSLSTPAQGIKNEVNPSPAMSGNGFWRDTGETGMHRDVPRLRIVDRAADRTVE